MHIYTDQFRGKKKISFGEKFRVTFHRSFCGEKFPVENSRRKLFRVNMIGKSFGELKVLGETLKSVCLFCPKISIVFIPRNISPRCFPEKTVRKYMSREITIATILRNISPRSFPEKKVQKYATRSFGNKKCDVYLTLYHLIHSLQLNTLSPKKTVTTKI